MCNCIFYDCMVDMGVISVEDVIVYGWIGLCLCFVGVDYDVWKVYFYCLYDQVDFDILFGYKGDNYDCYLVRIEEIKQLISIIQQCFVNMEFGLVNIDNWSIVLLFKEVVYNLIEGMIVYFKFIMEGIQVLVGEVYSYTEVVNGELGFFIVSLGVGIFYKIHVRVPCFVFL